MRCSQVQINHVVCMMVFLEISLQVTSELSTERTSETNTTFKTPENDRICSNCSSETTVKDTCSNSRGWNLRGSDWGCCGNYVGCCTYASYVCYVHDALCRCCNMGTFCGPSCKPEADCTIPGTQTFLNETVINRHDNSTESDVDENSNVGNFKPDLNHTEFQDTVSRNYYVRGRATSGDGGLPFQNGDTNLDGSGDAE